MCTGVKVHLWGGGWCLEDESGSLCWKELRVSASVEGIRGCEGCGGTWNIWQGRLAWSS